jgi:phage-related protein
MKWEIVYYSSGLQEEILDLPEGILARYIALSDRMETYGPNLGMPHTRAMGGGLFEIRAKGKEGIGRVFYCTIVGNRIMMLHCFVKKTEKTPYRELEIARKRLKEVKP